MREKVLFIYARNNDN